MTQYVELIGAEQVQSAGRSISSAADEMRRAASTIDEALAQHQRFLDEWLQRFESIMEKHNGGAV